jgi:uncharacterized protein (DUF488 family)
MRKALFAMRLHLVIWSAGAELIGSCPSPLPLQPLHYAHFPRLGILTAERKGSNSQRDYDLLFSSYRKIVLPCESDSLAKPATVMQNEIVRIVLCHEADPSSYHRSHLAAAIKGISGLEVVHLP